jgi:hypothetical protein
VNGAREVVQAWHDALNRGDVEQLIALSTEEIEVGGPRGRGSGPAAELLREWFGRAGVRMEPKQTFERDHVVVVEEEATWPGTEPQVVASVFRVEAGRVASVVRYADLSSALDAGGLTQEDHVLEG